MVSFELGGMLVLTLISAAGWTGKATTPVASRATIAAERRIFNAGFACVDLDRWLTHGLTDREVSSYQKRVMVDPTDDLAVFAAERNSAKWKDLGCRTYICA
jgi:hypothetical protein